MQPYTLDKQQARNIILHASALAQPAPFGTGTEAVYDLINHLGYLQIDTNYVVERAHHHAIFSRVPGYQPEWLGELQEDGRVFEFLMADSGFMPMEDYRFSLPVKESFRAHHKPLTKADLTLMTQILDRIGREGPLMVTDFENDRLEPSRGWWDWRPAKLALERLYLEGELMTTRTSGFKKLYDLPLNIVPAGTDTTMPSPEEYARHVILRTLKSLGIGYAKELAWRARFAKNNLVKQELERMVATHEVLTVRVEGLKSAPLYMLPEYLDRDIQLTGDAYILTPFDNLNVFRHRLRDFFDFDYQIECFVPGPKRKYGYFSLPVLVGDTFVARMDAKADRKNKVLLIHNLHFEPVTINDNALAKLIDAIRAFVVFNGCTDAAIGKCNNENYQAAIGEGLQ
jgi:uncharacterized protein YcaQ